MRQPARGLAYLLAMVVTATVASCVEFDEPACPARSARIDERLLGSWYGLGPDGRAETGKGIRFRRGKAGELQVDLLGFGGGAEADVFATAGHSCGTGNERTFNLRLRTAYPRELPGGKLQARKIYQIFRYVFVNSDELRVQAPLHEALVAAIDAGRLEGKADLGP